MATGPTGAGQSQEDWGHCNSSELRSQLELPRHGCMPRQTPNLLAKGTDKEKLAQLGFGAFCAYGVISNLNAACMIAIAWVTVVKTTGLMPLAAGNWPKFLAVYAGLWVTSNFLRPIRLSLAIAVAPFFDSALTAIMRRTGQKNKVVAFGIMLLMIAAGSITTVVLAIAVCGGFPVVS